jgi:hypothetical protein
MEDLTGECEFLLDFDTTAEGEDIVSGQPVGSAYAAWGVHITLFNRMDMTDPQEPIAFDSSAPPEGREQLSSPNVDFGGPGWGIGGAADGPAPNSLSLRNVLAANDAEPSWFQLLFDQPMCVHGVVYLDVGGFGVGPDNLEEGAQMVMYDFPDTSEEPTYVYTCGAMPYGGPTACSGSTPTGTAASTR